MPIPIRIDSLVKGFGGDPVLRSLSLEVQAGELFFLLGPSGCGKTTLLRCIAGLHEPDSGHIWAGDMEITQLPAHRRNMGMVFQSYALWPHMTLRENVSFGLEMRKMDKATREKRVNQALEMVKLADRAHSKPNELSGGQQQRVALARALVIEPQCLLLDEPLSNLDAKLRLEMRTEIRRICKAAGLTAIYVTHDQKEALSMADRVAILENGTLLQVGTPQEVYTRPRNSFVAQFIGETTLIPGTLSERQPDGSWIVSTAVGSWLGEGDGMFQSGDSVLLSIRPEAVQLHTDRTEGPNCFTGHLHDTVYLGEMAQHQMDMAGKLSLKVFEMHPRMVARDSTIETRMYIAPSDVRILRQ